MNRKLVRKKKQQEQARRTQIIIIGSVVIVALLVVALLIAQNPSTQPVAEITSVPTQTWPQANGKTMGPADAKVVVMEFADFQCPYCKVVHDKILPLIISDYVATSKVRFEFHHFVVVDGNVGGTESRRAAQASECAKEQGKFWDYFNILFTNQGTEGSGVFNDNRLKTYAAAVKLDTNKFNTCLSSNKYAQQVVDDETKAQDLSLSGTPALLVNNQLVQNPVDYTVVKAAIDAAIAAAK
jgi:protein-disulfide isomerase